MLVTRFSSSRSAATRLWPAWMPSRHHYRRGQTRSARSWPVMSGNQKHQGYDRVLRHQTRQSNSHSQYQRCTAVVLERTLESDDARETTSGRVASTLSTYLACYYPGGIPVVQRSDESGTGINGVAAASASALAHAHLPTHGIRRGTAPHCTACVCVCRERDSRI
jgi:hypothetical protein